MNRLSLIISGSVILLSVVSCATPKQNIFVLMPDRDGRTGRIVVENKAGAQVVSAPGQATKVTDSATAPTAPQPMDEREIGRIFGPAIAAEPLLPVSYMLYFKTGSAKLTTESTKLIPELLGTIRERNSTEISVVGHTDTVGTKQSNYELSFDRARQIKELLVAKGVDPGTIEDNSHGEDNPLVQTADEVAEPKNRRVEVTIR